MHWAEKYVGEPSQGVRPCWSLLRKVWADEAGLLLPSFDGEKNGLGVMSREAMKFEDVVIGNEKPLDAVFMNTDELVKGKWVEVEGHIGVVAMPGFVLHVERGGTAMIDPIKSLRVTRIKAGPWHAR